MASDADARMDRREFGARALRAGWWTLAATGAAATWATVRFFVPRATYEPPARFVAGRPADYAVGEVSVTHLAAQQVWIVRDEQGIYALVAQCTHLGCRPNWLAEEQRFKCPCHGSNFDRSGKVIAGPAPKPLRRAAISLLRDGRIRVDRSEQADLAEALHRPGFLLTAEAIAQAGA